MCCLGCRGETWTDDVDFLVLELLAVHPDYQGLGAGSGLVRWGTDKADEQGIEVGG